MTNTDKKNFNATIGNSMLPAVFLSGKDKAEHFQNELKASIDLKFDCNDSRLCAVILTNLKK